MITQTKKATKPKSAGAIAALEARKAVPKTPDAARTHAVLAAARANGHPKTIPSEASVEKFLAGHPPQVSFGKLSRAPREANAESAPPRDDASHMEIRLGDIVVLDNCRLHTEDGETREGIGITPELLDELRIKGKNPVWYLRVTWLEKIYGRRGRPQRREQSSAGAFTADAEEGSDVSSRPDLVHVLRERIKGLEQDKQDLRDEMKIKNQQMADRMEREKETNALIRDLHTLMADLQRRLPPPTQTPSSQIMEGRIDEARPIQRAEEAIVTKAKPTPPPRTPEKGSRASKDRRQERNQSRQKPAMKKSPIAKKPPQKTDAPPPTKSKSLWSRLFPR